MSEHVVTFLLFLNGRLVGKFDNLVVSEGEDYFLRYEKNNLTTEEFVVYYK